MHAMESGVEDITLGGGVTLDMETLAEFSGQKMCKEVALQRYSGQIQKRAGFEMLFDNGLMETLDPM